MAPASSRRTPLVRKAIASPGRGRPSRPRSRTRRARRCARCSSPRASAVADRPGRPARSPSPRRTGTSKVRSISPSTSIAQHALDRLRAQDADAVERPAGGDGGVEAGHVAGGRDAAGGGNDHPVQRQSLAWRAGSRAPLVRARPWRGAWRRVLQIRPAGRRRCRPGRAAR